MKKNIFSIVILVLCISFINTQNTKAQENRKLAQTGLKFLSVSTDARIAGMSNAITSQFGNSSSALYNPAGMAEQKNSIDVSFGQTKWIADISYNHATASFNLFGENYGIFGISLVTVDYGKLKGTIRAGNEAGFIDIGDFSPSAYAIGITYAKALSHQFSIGGNIKYANQNLIDNGIIGYLPDGGYEEKKYDLNTLAFDFGLIYKTGFKSLNIGMSVRNFSQELKYIEEQFQLPLTFKIGASMDLVDLFDIDKSKHSFLLAVDAATPRDYEEQVSFGAEYTFINSFSLRAGYTTPTDESGLALGFGIKQELGGILMKVDYSYTKFGVFGNVHQFGFSVAY